MQRRCKKMEQHGIKEKSLCKVQKTLTTTEKTHENMDIAHNMCKANKQSSRGKNLENTLNKGGLYMFLANLLDNNSFTCSKQLTRHRSVTST